MIRTLTVISCLVSAAISGASENQSDWIKFKENYGKIYNSSEEEEYRKGIFFSNVEKINEHNRRFQEGNESYEQGINMFTDMLPEEIQKLLTIDVALDREPLDHVSNLTFKGPISDYVNWVERGFKSTPRNQGGCGCCYAFAAVGAIEAQFFIKYKKLISLSEQDAIDCAFLLGSSGCGGGYRSHIFRVAKERGIRYASQVLYKGKLGTCENIPKEIYVEIKDYASIQPSTEEELKKAVATIGPITAEIHVTPNFHKYRSGIFYDPGCQGKSNHMVLIVGYGRNKDGVDYWIVKNSWGPNWGMEGYVLMSRNRGNNCGIARYPLFPTDPVL